MNSELSPSTDKALQDALSPLINNIIEENYEAKKEQMSAQIAPLIGPAIKEQIKSQKDEVVDALYPVIGNMISRYISKSLEEILLNINSKIQDGLSSQSIKRKIKAKIKGVSETELLLYENASSDIRAIFLIHKDTGIILSQSQNPNFALHEPDMMASMMTAIRSFVNDCISQDGEAQELGEIEYGGNKIILEASTHSYLAIMVEGASYHSTYERIRDVFSTIITKYGENIREFQGDLDNFSTLHIEDELNKLLINDTKEEETENTKQKVHPLMYIVPLLLLSWIAYSYYYSYKNNSVTQTANKALYYNPELTIYRLSVNVEDGIATLQGEVPFSYHKHLAEKVLEDIKDITKLENKIVVLPTLNNPMQISSNITYLLKGFNKQNGVSLSYNYSYDTLTLFGHFNNSLQKKQLLEELQHIKGLKNIKDKSVVTPLFRSGTLYFQRGSSSLSSKEESKLITMIQQLQDSDNNISLVLNSYSDLIGSEKDNIALAQERINTIIQFLQIQGKIKNKIITHYTNKPPKGVDPLREPQKARCIKLAYKKEK